MNHYDVEKMFWESRWKAEEQGLEAVKVMLGPDAYRALRQFLGTMGNLGVSVHDPAYVGKPATYNGLLVAKMRSEGVAVVTRRPGHFVKFQVAGKG